MSFEQNNNDLSLADIHHEVLLQLEAIIFASEAPVSIARLKEAFNNQYNKQQLRQLLQQLALLQHGRSIELIETAQGFRFQVRSKYRNIIAQIWPERPTKLSPSLLETLAVIAYHQPVTRADIEQIRGVSNNSQILRTLFDWKTCVANYNASISECFWSSLFRPIASPTERQGSIYGSRCECTEIIKRWTVDHYV